MSIITGGLGNDSLVNIETIHGGDYADVLTGDNLGSLFQGSPGNDMLNGSGNARCLEPMLPAALLRAVSLLVPRTWPHRARPRRKPC